MILVVMVNVHVTTHMIILIFKWKKETKKKERKEETKIREENPKKIREKETNRDNGFIQKINHASYQKST